MKKEGERERTAMDDDKDDDIRCHSYFSVQAINRLRGVSHAYYKTYAAFCYF
jgi:hypothetical protein